MPRLNMKEQLLKLEAAKSDEEQRLKGRVILLEEANHKLIVEIANLRTRLWMVRVATGEDKDAKD